MFHIYGLLIGIGIVLGFEAAKKLGLKRSIPEKIIDEILWWAVIPALIGARLYHVIDKWQMIYRFNPISVLYVWNGGLGIWGGVMGGMIGLFIYWKWKLKGKVNLLDLADCGALGLPLGQAIGRLGNFFNQELYGRATTLPWGIVINNLQGKYHPLFAYEALLNLGLFAILIKTSGKKIKPGILFGVYLIGYGVIRTLLEPLRPAGSVWEIGGIPTAIIVSLTAVVIGIGLICRVSRKQS